MNTEAVAFCQADSQTESQATLVHRQKIKSSLSCCNAVQEKLQKVMQSAVSIGLTIAQDDTLEQLGNAQNQVARP